MCQVTSSVPFTEKDELYTSLQRAWDERNKEERLSRNSLSPKTYLPGQPRIDLESQDVKKFLIDELLTHDLDKLAPNLWLLATPDSSHVSSLTHQKVKGRTIVITEKPELHLLWYYDRVFIKPLPKYLLSHAFWEFHLQATSSGSRGNDEYNIARAAKGFIRSYAYLIRHRSDFEVAAQDGQRLIPKNIKFASLVRFLSNFEGLPDCEVSPRFRYGELRLTRLNFWTKVFLRRSAYHRVHGQYADRVARTYGPFLFAFALLSVLLASFQVGLAAPQVTGQEEDWVVFVKMAQFFSVATLVVVGFVVMYVSAMIIFLFGREIIFATRKKLGKGRTLCP